DRHTAYPAMKQVKAGQIILALCWAHQRRDFIEAERGHPELHAWASDWLGRIADLYRLNDARLLVWQPEAAAVAAADPELPAPGAGEPGPLLGGLDGVGGAPGSAAGQQRGGACGARPGGGAEELLRQWRGVGGSTGGGAVLDPGDAAAVGAQSAAMADGLLDG